ncbi:hypothetical protein DIURU_002636 [Diutina rugosa]|uniref:Probable metalloprotease ARX1 n=1 Tax=Diutina rugosa TaxID=5481 RepID=A0A642UP98_DIURU|nr:uncharacterized protein DIURU_002636 [Diutina rugosa]KAA8902740.1 hypothetical protein DIURU_002636 [Diutina rugosa]
MSLAVHQDDADVLLHSKNVLDDRIVEKYRVAGQIVQTALVYLESIIANPPNGAIPTITDLCVLTDSYMAKLLAKAFTSVREKGIAVPTQIDINELASGFAPEVVDEKGSTYVLSVGDVAKVTLGVHIDGYTATVSHTIVVYPQEGERAPLVGAKADAVCAAHVATETLVAYLGLVLAPEKTPQSFRVNGAAQVTGSQIRQIVDTIADAYNCVVVPGSKVRRVRRFLAGQAEGIVAEREFKGVVWDESHQESKLLAQAAGTDLIKRDATVKSDPNSAIPTDDFVVEAGEVFQIDIRMAPMREMTTAGIVTLEEIDHFTGKNGKNEFNCRPTMFVRDYAVTHQLKLKSARKLLAHVDKKFTVYPFKLTYCSSQFPLPDESAETLEKLVADVKQNKLGLAEVQNRHLVKAKPIQMAKFIDLKTVVDSCTTTGRHGVDAAKPVLPGMEVPLPQLGMTSLKLKSLLKHAVSVPVVREATTVVLNQVDGEVLRLTGGSAAPVAYVHSDYTLPESVAAPIGELMALTQDAKYGLTVKQCKHYKVDFGASEMQLD